MVTASKPTLPGHRPPLIAAGLPVLTGSLLVTIHAEIGEMMRELQESRRLATALERLCERHPELRAELVAEVQRVLDEQLAAAQQQPTPAPPKRRRK